MTFFTFLFIITSLADYKAVASVNSVHNICVAEGERGITSRTSLLPLFVGGYRGLWGGLWVRGLWVRTLLPYGTLTLICIKYLLFSSLSRSFFLFLKSNIISKKRK